MCSYSYLRSLHTYTLLAHRTSPRAILGRLALLVSSQAKPSCLSNPNLTRTSQGTGATNNIGFRVFTFTVSSNFQSSTRVMRMYCVGVSISRKQLSCFFASADSWWGAVAGKTAISSAYHTPRSSPEI